MNEVNIFIEMYRKVGAVVKGRVMLIDASRKKASLTLKPSMVKDKRHLIVSYKHVRSSCSIYSLGY